MSINASSGAVLRDVISQGSATLLPTQASSGNYARKRAILPFSTGYLKR